MSENATEAAPEATDTTSTEDATALPDWAQKQLDKARQEAAKYRTRVRELEPQAAKAQELENRDKTELERAAEKASTAEARVAEAEARAVRLEVAFEKGLTVAQAKRLVGSTREELEADADEVLRDFPVKPAGPVKPEGDIAQGTRTTAAITDPRARDLAQIEADLKAGTRR